MNCWWWGKSIIVEIFVNIINYVWKELIYKPWVFVKKHDNDRGMFFHNPSQAAEICEKIVEKVSECKLLEIWLKRRLIKYIDIRN